MTDLAANISAAVDAARPTVTQLKDEAKAALVKADEAVAAIRALGFSVAIYFPHSMQGTCSQVRIEPSFTVKL